LLNSPFKEVVAQNYPLQTNIAPSSLGLFFLQFNKIIEDEEQQELDPDRTEDPNPGPIDMIGQFEADE